MIRLPARRWTRSTRTCLAAALVCGVLAGAGCGDTTAPVPGPVESAPAELQFSWSTFEPGGGTTLELRGSTVVVRRIQWGRNVRIDSTMVVPTSGAWARFLDAAAEAGVREWRSGYLAERYVDGAAWDLRLAVDGQVLVSGGTNAYPDRSGQEHEIYPTDEFLAFISALGELTGQPIF